MKIVLAGSPEISVKTFEEVINNFDVIAIITQPDRQKGRGMVLTETPVSKLGSKYGIKTFKPEKISSIEKELKDLNYDLFLTFAFGQWIPSSILSLGKFKPMNIHGSLLPKYRGAAPIHYAILNGDKEIGITLMEMIKEMDAGDMYFKASKKINIETTTGDAFKIIEELAAENIVDWIHKIEEGNMSPEKQSQEFSLAPKISKSYGELKNKMSYDEIKRLVKGLNPFPGAFAYIGGKRLKVFNISNKHKDNAIEFESLNGTVFIIDYQWEGKKRQTI